MTIGTRLRNLREKKKLSQGDIEKRTGLLRCYISRVENGYTVPSLGTLEKLAAALEVPLYQLFYDGEQPALTHLNQHPSTEEVVSDEEHRFFEKVRKLTNRVKEEDRQFLLHLAQKLASR